MNHIIPCRLVALEERKIARGAKKVPNGEGGTTTEFEYEPNGWWATMEFDRTRVSFRLGDEQPSTPLTITLDPNL